MTYDMVVTQTMGVSVNNEKMSANPTHLRVALSTAMGDSGLNLITTIDKAPQFVVGSTVTVNVGGLH